MKLRIVADTNVIVSALVFGGLPRLIFELADAGACNLYFSTDIQSETRRVLKEKFLWDERTLDSYLSEFWKIGSQVLPTKRVRVVADDPDDDRILECALAAQADVIVSGDRHLLALGAYEVITILSPRQFLNEYFSKLRL